MVGLGCADDVYRHYLKVIDENKQLEKKLEIAVNSINSAADFLTCMDDLSELNNGKCNEQMALEVLNSALTKIKGY